MIKEELIKLLKEYRENKSKLRLRKRELEKIEKSLIKNRHPELEKGIVSTYGINKDIRSKNSISNRVENAIMNSEEKQLQAQKKKEELKEQIKDLEELVEEAEIILDSLYKKEREILTAYYVDNRTAEDIAINLYFKLYNRTCDPRSIYRLIEKTTERLLKL